MKEKDILPFIGKLALVFYLEGRELKDQKCVINSYSNGFLNVSTKENYISIPLHSIQKIKMPMDIGKFREE